MIEEPAEASERLDYGRQPAPWRVRARKACFVIAVAVAVLWAIGWGCLKSMEPKVGRNVSAASAGLDMPAGANHVNFYRGGAMDPVSEAFECDVSEPNFRAWAAAHQWPLQQGSFQVIRFDMSRTAVERGLLYEWHQDDTGYDLDAGRMYYFSHTR
jgi:hypothetical protein